MSDAGPKERSSPLRRIGYHECRRAIERLGRFRDLLRHRERWGTDHALAAPLETLVGPEPLRSDPRQAWLTRGPDPLPTDPWQQGALVVRTINRLIPLVYGDLRDAGIPTRLTWTDYDSEWDDEKKCQVTRERKRAFDVITDCVSGRADAGTRDASHFHTTAMAVLEQGIGVYDEIATRRVRGWLNPLNWIAAVAEWPVVVLERAGLLEEQRSKLLVAYGYAVRTLWILTLVLLLRKLGAGDVADAILSLIK